MHRTFLPKRLTSQQINRHRLYKGGHTTLFKKAFKKYALAIQPVILLTIPPTKKMLPGAFQISAVAPIKEMYTVTNSVKAFTAAGSSR